MINPFFITWIAIHIFIINNYYLILALNIWIMPTLVAKLFYLVTWLHVSVIILNNLNDASLYTLVLT